MPKVEKTAPPVFPNAGVEQWYYRTLHRMIDGMTSSVALHIKAAYKDGPVNIGFAQDANKAESLRKAMRKWGEIWQTKIDEMADDIAERFAKKSSRATDVAVAESFKQAGLTVAFRPTQATREAYSATVAENVNLIKSIPAQYLKDVQSRVWSSVMKGGDLHTLSTELRETYGVTVRRAALIANDQNAKAKAVMENVRRQELGVEEAIWMHSHAGKEPRPTHVAMNGKRYKLKKGMYDSAVQQYVWPGTLINCRCTSRAVIPGF